VSPEVAVRCNFSAVTGSRNHFGDILGSRFTEATLRNTSFEGDFSEVDFSNATLDGATFSRPGFFGKSKNSLRTATRFTKATLISTVFREMVLKTPDFSGADLSQIEFHNCVIDGARFTKAVLRGANLVGSKFTNADFTDADMTGVNLAAADLTGSQLRGANLRHANLRGAKTHGVDFSKAKHYEPASASAGSIGPALTELDQLCASAKRIQLKFSIRYADDKDQSVGIDSSGLKWGYGVQLPTGISAAQFHGRSRLSFSDAMMQLANVAGHLPVRFETVDVSTTKSPKGGKELRELAMRGIAEAFAQEIPKTEDLANATKKYRDSQREKGAAAREEREKAKAAAEKEKVKAKKQIAKKIEKAVGKVNDVASFLKALELRIEKPKIEKATKMLKASGFKLFNDVTDQHVSGVVKSQTDPHLVYACRVAHDGQYSCCTQNLNVCGGLRGSLCKHQLVLIIGLVQAGELDPTTIDSWIAKTLSVKPELDKEDMGAIFIKYKGAEAGEVDWRPTETVPEDYYAL
jgi:uncharacterized protein YjbI with pentapeptide repeats